MRYILILLFCCLSFVAGYAFKGLENTACVEPEHVGDVVVLRLIDDNGVIVMKTERHSTLKSTVSQNRD